MNNIRVENANWALHKEGLIALRTEVFVEEQNVPPSLEIDGLDTECLHVRAMVGDRVVGTGRLLPNGYIGRMCVDKSYRDSGIGRLLLNNLANQAIEAQYPVITLNSQVYAIPFYEKCGFVVDSDEFMDAGIPHRRMTLDRDKFKSI